MRGTGRVAWEDRGVLRWLTAGESHGPALVGILEGVPVGVPITTKDIGIDLARRRLGVGRGARMSFERDEVEVLGGVRHGLTIGGPVAIRVGNTEWPKWETVMSADPVDAEFSRDRHATPPSPGPGRVTQTSSACRSTASTMRGPYSNVRARGRLRRASPSAAWRGPSSVRSATSRS